MGSSRASKAWYYLRSFFRREWRLEDYPVSVRAQPGGTPAPDGDGKWMPAYVAMIDGMFLVGMGATADAARADLRAKFEEFRKENELPRPGTQQPIRYVESERIEAFGAVRDDFVERVLRLSWAFISDESTLDQFEEPEELKRRIALLYGIDTDRLPDQRIVTILEAIANR
ncbi:MAG TPA: hypothetical protein VE269_06325 [Gaiellaceae bacterium]|nr:hypothetical protein [Gaiellaceae bacterium]